MTVKLWNAQYRKLRHYHYICSHKKHQDEQFAVLLFNISIFKSSSLSIFKLIALCPL